MMVMTVLSAPVLVALFGFPSATGLLISSPLTPLLHFCERPSSSRVPFLSLLTEPKPSTSQSSSLRQVRASIRQVLALESQNDASNEGDIPSVSSSKSSSTSLYEPLPEKKPWTLGILTSGTFAPPQQILVPVVKFITFQVWKLMMNELVAHDDEGRFIRESFRAGDTMNTADLEVTGDSLTLDLPVKEDMEKLGPKYRLYLGNPCPWCHRVKAAVALLGLEKDIPVTMLIDDAEKASKGGWILPKPTPDSSKFQMHEELFTGDLAGVYNYCYRDLLPEGVTKYQGRCTAPLLVDAHAGRIVTNESNDIMAVLNDYARRKRASEGHTSESFEVDLRPVGMEKQLDAATKYWFNLLWNGAYRCGFATSQVAYDEAASDVLRGLSELDSLLGTQPYMMGETITEIDVKTFAWVTRHDYAYTVIFKCPGGRIAQYTHIAGWVKRMANAYPVMLDTVDIQDACGSYYRQLFMLNFGRIVPKIPTIREWISEM